MRYFLAAANDGNITKAAEALGISQPALSRCLAQLEEELGAQLFVRGVRGIELTKKGYMFKRRCAEVMELVDKTRNELRRCGREKPLTGEITIGAGELAAADALAEYIGIFSKRHPHVCFNLYTGSADHIKDMIDRGLTDAGLLLEPVDIEKHDFVRLGHIRERWVALIPPQFPIACRSNVTPEELAGYPVIMVRRAGVRGMLENWFGEHYNLRVTFTSNLSANAANLVRRGLGCALVIEGSVAHWDEASVCRRPLSPELYSTSVLAWKRGQQLSAAVERFVSGARMHFKHCSGIKGKY